MLRKSILTLIPVCLLLTSCVSWWGSDPVVVPSPDAAKPSISINKTKEAAAQAKEDIKNAAENIGKSVDGIKNANRDISGAAKDIKKKDPKGELKGEVGEIEKGVSDIVEHLKGLQAAGEQLTSAESRILELSALIMKAESDAKTYEAESAQKDELIKGSAEKMAKLEKENAQLKSDKAEAIQAKLIYLVIAGVLALAMSAWMFVQGNTRAIAMGAAAVVLIIGALAVSFFMKGMALVGFIVVAVVFVLLAFKMYMELREKRAKKELVKTVEHIKDNIDEPTKKKLFGDRVTDGEVGNIQSEETKELIRKERKVLKEEFDPIT